MKLYSLFLILFSVSVHAQSLDPLVTYLNEKVTGVKLSPLSPLKKGPYQVEWTNASVGSFKKEIEIAVTNETLLILKIYELKFKAECDSLISLFTRKLGTPEHKSFKLRENNKSLCAAIYRPQLSKLKSLMKTTQPGLKP